MLAPLAGRIYDDAPQQNAFPLDAPQALPRRKGCSCRAHKPEAVEMMMTNWLTVAFAAIALTTGSLKASAQSRPQIVVAGGPIHVDREYSGQSYSHGAHAQLSATWPKQASTFGLRLDAFALRLRQEYDGDPTDDFFAGVRSSHAIFPGLTASVTVFPLLGTSAWLQPYALVGPGFYNSEHMWGTRYEVHTERNWHFLLSGGAGVQFGRGRRGVSIEARKHGIVSGTGPRMIPISLGFRL